MSNESYFVPNSFYLGNVSVKTTEPAVIPLCSRQSSQFPLVILISVKQFCDSTLLSFIYIYIKCCPWRFTNECEMTFSFACSRQIYIKVINKKKKKRRNIIYFTFNVGIVRCHGWWPYLVPVVPECSRCENKVLVSIKYDFISCSAHSLSDLKCNFQVANSIRLRWHRGQSFAQNTDALCALSTVENERDANKYVCWMYENEINKMLN